MRNWIWIPGTAALLGCAAGCHEASVSVNYHESRPTRETRVHVTHVCTPECRHFYDGDRVVVIRERHRHGPGCGHYFNGRHWVVQVRHDPGPPPRKRVVTEHRHGPNCGCVFDRSGSKWVAVEQGHVHGPGCGHARVNGRWVLRR